MLLISMTFPGVDITLFIIASYGFPRPWKSVFFNGIEQLLRGVIFFII